ncbi:MAG: aldehyde ferredoxin oxidoreductase C-terminal domain-containing protein, partial [Dehalococcoidales bacterium]|nr:aldehyde ferredoxin oxidoreductase C-terminal domain-containing protein [Dehalococcoidales bacterium]
MSNLYGYAGKILRVDLSHERITEEELDEATARKYIGGTGLGAKYLYDEVPAGVEWSDEANRLILASGPLGGTAVGGSGTFSVVTKGALSNGAVATQSNGFFGAFLRFAGFDGIIIQGKASRWVYLYLDKGKAELRDASHLLGKDTWETTDLIKSENGQEERGMSVVSIGPAGENLVRFASIFADKGHAASHDGVGAVLGSKKLKAIAVVRGRGRPRMKDREVFSATAKQYLEGVMNDPRAVSGIYTWGTLNLLTRSILAKDGSLPVKNYTTNIYDIEPEKLEKFGGPYIRSHFEPKPSPCWGCRFHHCHMLTLTEGPFKGYVGEEPEYEGFAAFGPVIGVTDVTAAIFLSNEADRLGVDVNETSWTIALAIECYEKGLLTREDTDQLELTWGNYGAVNQLLHKIATRQGFGNVLAEGAMRVARSIGGEATNFAIHTMKGNTPRGHDHRNRWPMLFDTCLSQMSTDEGRSTLSAAEIGLSLDPKVDQSQSVEYIVASNVYGKGDTQFEDSLGVCRFTCRTDLKLHAQALSAATGWDFSIEEAKQVGKRIVNLLRTFNIRHGHTAEMDAPSPRYGSA